MTRPSGTLSPISSLSRTQRTRRSLRHARNARNGMCRNELQINIFWHCYRNKFAQSNFGIGPRCGAVAHIRRKIPLVTMARPKFAPKSTLSSGPISKPHYLPHPWTRPTFDAKRHPDPICRFATMHWTDRPTDARTYGPTDRPRESLTTIGRCATRATRPKNSKAKEKESSFWVKDFLSGDVQNWGSIIRFGSFTIKITNLSNAVLTVSSQFEYILRVIGP